MTPAFHMVTPDRRRILPFYEFTDLRTAAFGTNKSGIQYAQSLWTSFGHRSSKGDETADGRGATVSHADMGGGSEVIETWVVDGCDKCG